MSDDKTEEKEKSQDNLDLESLRISQNFHEKIGVKKKFLSIPVRKPKKQEFVMLHPDPKFRAELALISYEAEKGEVYVVHPSVAGVAEDSYIALVGLAINTQGNPFLWWVKKPTDEMRNATWSSSGLEAMDEATKGWIKVKANMDIGAYDIYQPLGNLPDPEWPEDYSFNDLIKIAFKEKFINSPEHPVLKALRGEE